jgi:hypothetical protein
MAKGKAHKKATTHVELAQVPDDSAVGQLKQLQLLFSRFGDVPSKKRTKVWGAFEEHVRKHGETPSTRSFKAHCLLFELDDEVNERGRCTDRTAAAFRDYMHATYLDAQGPPHSITALCLFAHFLNGEHFRRTTDDTRTLADLKDFLDTAMKAVLKHGTNFIDPSLELMVTQPALLLGWEQCSAPDPRLQILHRSKWLRQKREEVGRALEAALLRAGRREHPALQGSSIGLETNTVRSPSLIAAARGASVAHASAACTTRRTLLRANWPRLLGRSYGASRVVAACRIPHRASLSVYRAPVLSDVHSSWRMALLFCLTHPTQATHPARRVHPVLGSGTAAIAARPSTPLKNQCTVSTA